MVSSWPGSKQDSRTGSSTLSRRSFKRFSAPAGVVEEKWLNEQEEELRIDGPDETESSHSADDEPGTLRLSNEYLLRFKAGIDRQLARLAPLREHVAQIEAINLETKIKAAALPNRRKMDKLLRYETAIDRKQDRAYARLERLQKRRREKGGEDAAVVGGA